MESSKTRVLDVGQCMPDHLAIRELLAREFGAQVDQASYADEAFEVARTGTFDLVLVNRVLDADGDSGLDLIRKLLSDEATRTIPVMLVSNYNDAQAEAAALGAQPGFGKAALRDAPTVARLGEVLKR